MTNQHYLGFIAAILLAGKYAHSSQGKDIESCVDEAEALIAVVNERVEDDKRPVGRPRKS